MHELRPTLPDPKASKLWFRNAHSLRSRNAAASVSNAQLPFSFLCSSPFSLDPLADVRRTILELDAVTFAGPKKTDNLLIHEPEIFQVQDDAPTARFGADQRFQLAYVFCAHSTAHLKDHLSVRRPLDLEHPPSPGTGIRNSEFRQLRLVTPRTP